MSVFDIAIVLAGAFLGSLLRVSRLGAALGMSLLLPLCFVLKPDIALVGLVSIYCGAKIGKGDSDFLGAIFAGLLAALIIPPISRFAATLAPSEFLALGILFLVSLTLAEERRYFFHSLAALGAGLFIPTIGIDILTGVQRYSFDIAELHGGIDFVVVALGVCCLGEIFYSVAHEKVTFRIDKKIPHGIESSESARHVGELIPAISLGMPCNTETAILVGAFSLYGLSVPNVSFSSLATMIVSGITAKVLISNFLIEPSIRFSQKSISEFFAPATLYPLFATVAFCGAYSLNYRVFDMLLLLFFGVLGFVMRRFSFPTSLFLVGFVLSPRIEQALRATHSWSWLNITLYAISALIIWNTLLRWRTQGKPSERRE